MLVAVGSSSLAVSTTVSGWVVPLASRRAPSVEPEFAQPRPTAPALPHGHPIGSEPSPEQKLVNAPSGTIWNPLTEPDPPTPATSTRSVPPLTLTRCSAYVVPGTCGEPFHRPPTFCVGSGEP